MAVVVDASLHLLDRQIVDRDGRMVGKVDDLEIAVPDGGGLPVVQAILCGQLALGPRIGGRLGVWVMAIGRRLRAHSSAGPVRIGFGAVADAGTVVKLTITAEQAGATALEAWCAEKVITRLPGGNRADG